jgi:hypothetical protein
MTRTVVFQGSGCRTSCAAVLVFTPQDLFGAVPAELVFIKNVTKSNRKIGTKQNFHLCSQMLCTRLQAVLLEVEFTHMWSPGELRSHLPFGWAGRVPKMEAGSLPLPCGFLHDREQSSIECGCGGRAFSRKLEMIALWQAVHKRLCSWHTDKRNLAS